MSDRTADGHVVCRASDLRPGERRIVQIGGLSIGVFNVGGKYVAVNNRCPHKGGPLCLGVQKSLVTGPAPHVYELERDGEILACPWHGWEFDLMTGRSVFEPEGVRVRRYPVSLRPEMEGGPEEDVRLETFPVSVERQQVVVHLERGRLRSKEDRV